MRTYELPGSDHKNGCTGPAAVPRSQNQRFRGAIVEEALLLATTAIYIKLSVVLKLYSSTGCLLCQCTDVMTGDGN